MPRSDGEVQPFGQASRPWLRLRVNPALGRQFADPLPEVSTRRAERVSHAPCQIAKLGALVADKVANVHLPEGITFSPCMCAFLAKRKGIGPTSASRKAVHLRLPYVRQDLHREMEFQLERAQMWIEGKTVRTLKKFRQRTQHRAPSPTEIWDAASESDATDSAI